MLTGTMAWALTLPWLDRLIATSSPRCTRLAHPSESTQRSFAKSPANVLETTLAQQYKALRLKPLEPPLFSIELKPFASLHLLR